MEAWKTPNSRQKARLLNVMSLVFLGTEEMEAAAGAVERSLEANLGP